jgi:hypothetical protein
MFDFFIKHILLLYFIGTIYDSIYAPPTRYNIAYTCKNQ